MASMAETAAASGDQVSISDIGEDVVTYATNTVTMASENLRLFRMRRLLMIVYTLLVLVAGVFTGMHFG